MCGVELAHPALTACAKDTATGYGERMPVQHVAKNIRTSCLACLLACLLFQVFSGYARAFDTPGIQQDAVVLTSAERAYLNQHKKITLCVDPDWVPYERIDAAGKHVGIAADLLSLVSARTGIVFELVPTRDWNESLDFSKTGQCQVLSLADSTCKCNTLKVE